MKARGYKKLGAVVLLAAALLAIGCSGVGAQPPSNPTTTADNSDTQKLPFTENKPVVIPASTAIYVRLQQSLSSKTAQAGRDSPPCWMNR